MRSKTAGKEVDLDGLPVLALGYSRGGGLAVEYGAVAGANDVPVPDAIMGVLPAGFGNAKSGPTSAARDRRASLMVGDQDAVVGGEGAAFSAHGSGTPASR